jgi:hypothetical protein
LDLKRYTYIAGLGSGCATTYQTQRAAVAQGLETREFSSPFDWFHVDLEQVIATLKDDFKNFFDPRAVRVQGKRKNTWKVADHSGIVSWHHMPIDPASSAPDGFSWYWFGRWLGARLELWKARVGDRSGKVLFVRAPTPGGRDEPAEVLRLVDELSKVVVASFRLALISYEPLAVPVTDPRILPFTVERSWPDSLPVNDVNWNLDYGRGIAWRGSNECWDKVWRGV